MIWTLRVLLGIVFAYVGVTKITGTANTPAYFDAIGWGQWFRYLTGSMDLIGTALLFIPRLTFYGALILISSVGTATLISFTILARNPVWGGSLMMLVPLVLTLLAGLLAFLTRPFARTRIG